MTSIVISPLVAAYTRGADDHGLADGDEQIAGRLNNSGRWGTLCPLCLHIPLEERLKEN